MPQLPRAVLFDLDDTIIAAYSHPRLAWTAVVGEFAPDLRALSMPEVVDAILASAQAIRSDPQRHRVWRNNLPQSRRDSWASTRSLTTRMATDCRRDMQR